MPDVIRLLPDSVANQIAAGEVIQRPASAVKELLENAVDAGATEIKLIIKDAGRTLIQVIDNGCGMSETDARLCFDRHATSKIKEASDLFAIKTMGFRGEALASIAAIAHVELKTKRKEDEVGTMILIEGSEFKSQEPCSCNQGVSFSVKNIFFNVPARRNFLKSDPIETSHIIEELTRVALAFSDVSFQFYHNDKEIYVLERSTLKQRIINLVNKNFKDKIIPIEQQVDFISISGFIGKPEFAKKTRGEQYFFVNNRFIKHPYLYHALLNAYEELIPANSHPSYFIFFQVDPQTIDINIHPTKTEIKFTDEKLVYAVLRSAAKHALGKSNLVPSLDFEREQGMDLPLSYKNKPVTPPSIKVNPDYNPFKEFRKLNLSDKNNRDNWEKLYPIETPELKATPAENLFVENKENTQQMQQEIVEHTSDKESMQIKEIIQLNNKYIVASVDLGLIVINQQLAHERILYEYFLKQSEKNESSQQQLFPETIDFSANDASLLRELLEDIRSMGFSIEALSGNTFVVNGIPAGAETESVQEMIEVILENFRQNLQEVSKDRKNTLAISMAKSMAIHIGKSLSKEEMIVLTNGLFACNHPSFSPSGKSVFTIIEHDEIAKRLRE